jgi:hypothetical protein
MEVRIELTIETGYFSTYQRWSNEHARAVFNPPVARYRRIVTNCYSRGFGLAFSVDF